MSTSPHGPQVQRFINWLEREKSNGLVDLKYTLADGVARPKTEEDAARALMDVIEAPSVTDPELCRLD